MSEFNEYRCPACGLTFSSDLTADECFHCPLCAHKGIEVVTIKPIIEVEESEILEAEVLRELRGLFGLPAGPH